MKLIVEGKRVFYSGRATSELIAILPLVEGRRTWSKGRNAPPGLFLEATKHNIDLLLGLPGVSGVDDRDALVHAFDQGNGGPKKELVFKSKTEPFPHQQKAVDRIFEKRYFGFFGTQGSGKTKVSIDWASALYEAGLITGKIIVSKNGPHRQWLKHEFPRHCFCDWSGHWWPWNERLPLGFHGGLQVVSFNYDGLKTPRGMKAALDFARKHKGKLLITLDESQEAKNPDSARYKAVWELREFSSHRLITTGTPIAKNLLDEWSQINWLDPSIIGMKYQTTFKRKFCILGGFGNRSVIGHQNMEEFRKLVDPYTMRVEKEELGLIPPQFEEIPFTMSKEQKEAIRTIKEELFAEVGPETKVNVPTSAVALTKIQQVSNGFIMDNDGQPRLIMPLDENPRIQNMLAWCQEIEGKKLIWFRFRQDQKMIKEVLDAEGISNGHIFGGTSDEDRDEAVRSFLDPDGIEVLFANPTSAGTGYNMQGLCLNALYYSNSHNSIERWQSQDRIHRIGTKGIVTYYDLIARGSPDRAILFSHKTKKAISDMAIGDLFRTDLD